MKSLLPALLLACALAPAAPAFAQDASTTEITPEQQDCLTWLALAARFANSGEQRIAFNQDYLRLNRLLSPGTDEVPPPSADETHVNSPEYDKWVMDHVLASEETKLQMIDALTDKATACEPLVPSEDTPPPAVQ